MNAVLQFLKRLGLSGGARQDAPGRPTQGRAAPAPLLMALEPRVVYDASVAAVATQPHAAHADTATANDATQHAAPKTVADHDTGRGRDAGRGGDGQAGGVKTADGKVDGSLAASSKAGASSSSAMSSAAGDATLGDTKTSDAVASTDTNASADAQKTLLAADAIAVSAASHSVVFIDTSVSNIQALIAGLPQGTQYVILDATTDGFAQMADYLQAHPGVDAIHLISHGMDGMIQAGSTWLNASDLAAESAQLARIGAAMNPGGDFLIYGCDVAQNADGQQLVREVAALTHLNVAASVDATGAASLGGNWTLEYQSGTVHTAVIESADAQARYDGLLGLTVETYDSEIGTQKIGSSFTLNGVVYTTDAASSLETDVLSGTGLPLSSGTADGVLMFNMNDIAVPLRSVTISMADGKNFTLSSFDLDASTDGAIYIRPNGDASKEVLIYLGPGNGLGGAFDGTVDLSTNANFTNVSFVQIVDVESPGFMAPTLDNLAYAEVAGPVVTTSTGSAAWSSSDAAIGTGGTPVVVDAGLTLSDGTSGTANTATVRITNFQTGDMLGFTAQYGISGVYDTGTGVLTLNASAGTVSIAQWQTVLESVTYSSTLTSPGLTTTARVISFSFNDGAASSNVATRDVTVTATDQSPVVAGSGPTGVSYTAGAGAVLIDGTLTVSDADNATLSSATIAISSGYVAGDILLFTPDSSRFGNIIASYSGGVLTLTSDGSPTLAQWQAALDSISFQASGLTTAGTRDITFRVDDGVKSSVPVHRSVVVSVGPTVITDAGSASFVSGDNVASTPVAIDSGITVADGGSTLLTSALVQITGNFQPNHDVLIFTGNAATMGDISGIYDGASGELRLTSASGATASQWQAALRSIAYTSDLVVPSNATRTISYQISDSASTSVSATRTVTVTAVDQTPLLAGSGGSTSFTAGDNTASTPVAIDPGLTVTDADNTTLASATVQIGTGFHAGEDVLSFINDGATMGNITAYYDPVHGTLTLTSVGASATLAQWQSALRAVTYTDTAITPDTSPRTIGFTVDDGVKTSAALLRTVTVAATDQTPLLSGTTDTVNYLAGDAGTLLDSGMVLTDLDAGASGAGGMTITFTFTSGFQSGDVLQFTYNASTMGSSFSVNFDGATGQLIVSASAGKPLAELSAILESIQFSTGSGTPSGTRTLSVTADDGEKTSAALTYTINVTGVLPVLTSSSSGSAAFVAGDNTAAMPVVIDSGVEVSDSHSSTLASATVQIGAGFQVGEDMLSFTNDGLTMGNIVARYDPTTGKLELTSVDSTATLAQWQSALRSVTYVDTAVTPNTTMRTISFSVNDGVYDSAALSRTVTVEAVDQTPILATTSTGPTAFVAGDNAVSTPVVIDAGVVVSDLDNGTLAKATVQIGTGFHVGEDVLSFTNDGATMGNIVGSYDATTGTLILTSVGSSATLAQWQAALRAVTYTDTAVTPDTAVRTVSFTVGDGLKTSVALTRTIVVTDTDQAPIVDTGSTGSVSFVSGDGVASTPIAIDAGITVSDLDNFTLATATVRIGAGFAAGEDVLAFVNDGASMGNITASYDAAHGTLTLTSVDATATLAQWQAALRAVTYTDTAVIPMGAARTISFTVNDGTKDSAAYTRQIDLTATTQTPAVVPGTGQTPVFTAIGQGAEPVAVDSGITIADPDANARLQAATITISGNFQPGRDVLAFTASAATGNIVASYNAQTGVLTLTSAGDTATLAQWQAALAAVTYADTASESAGSSRTIAIQVTIGDKHSAVVSRTVDIAAAPVVVPPPTQPTEPTAPTQPVVDPAPPAIISLLPPPPVFGGAPAGNARSTPRDTPASDVLPFFPMNLADNISNPLIVVDALADGPVIGAIPGVTTVTFSATEIGEVGDAGGAASWGGAAGPRAHESLSRTTVYASPSIPAPDMRELSLSQAEQTVRVDAGPNQPFSVSLPLMLGADGSSSTANAHVFVRMSDGRPLPGWIRFDPVRGTLDGKAPSNGGALHIQIVVRDADGHESRREMTIQFASRPGQADAAPMPDVVARVSMLAETPAPPARLAALPAKPSLSEQFARAHASLHIARPATVSGAAQAAAPVHRFGA